MVEYTFKLSHLYTLCEKLGMYKFVVVKKMLLKKIKAF